MRTLSQVEEWLRSERSSVIRQQDKELLLELLRDLPFESSEDLSKEHARSLSLASDFSWLYRSYNEEAKLQRLRLQRLYAENYIFHKPHGGRDPSDTCVNNLILQDEAYASLSSDIITLETFVEWLNDLRWMAQHRREAVREQRFEEQQNDRFEARS